MVPWPLFIKRVALVIGLIFAAVMTWAWWMTGDEMALGILGGVWAWVQITVGIVNLIWRER